MIDVVMTKRIAELHALQLKIHEHHMAIMRWSVNARNTKLHRDARHDAAHHATRTCARDYGPRNISLKDRHDKEGRPYVLLEIFVSAVMTAQQPKGLLASIL